MENTNEARPSIFDLYTEAEPVCSLIDSICVRPKMYTINTTLGEWAAFLEGYSSGMASHSPIGPDQQWSAFLSWANREVCGDPHGGFRGLANALQERCVNDDQAFFEIAKLCIEYRRLNGPFIK